MLVSVAMPVMHNGTPKRLDGKNHQQFQLVILTF